MGYEVRLASNGEAGCTAMLEYHPDIVLLDIKMPVLDGYGFIDRVKKNADLAKIPIVVVTNLSLAETKEELIGRGVADCIEKTAVTPKQLAERIEEILGRDGRT